MVDMVFLVFIGFLYPPPTWKGFSLGPEEFHKRFSFGGGRVLFFLLCEFPGEGGEAAKVCGSAENLRGN